MNEDNNELECNTYTNVVYLNTTCGEPIEVKSAKDVEEGIKTAIELENRPVFLEGVAERLSKLGVKCTPEDTDIILSEVKARFKRVLDKACPRTVQEWCRGTTPGFINRQNNYELCYALEMNYEEVATFFQKRFLTLPFVVKARTDAVFMYCFYHGKPYSTALKLLEASKDYQVKPANHTSTSRIMSVIFETDDDEGFLRYLSEHCYGNEQQFSLAKKIINNSIDEMKEKIKNSPEIEKLSPDRLNSLTISELLGYRYQSVEKGRQESRLPKRFTESLPNDVTLGRIINGDAVSYELLRKTMMLLKFYNFYKEAEIMDSERSTDLGRYEVNDRLMDFYYELNSTLVSCGFAGIYFRHPFDSLLMYCANTYDPILTLHILNERN